MMNSHNHTTLNAFNKLRYASQSEFQKGKDLLTVDTVLGENLKTLEFRIDLQTIFSSEWDSFPV